LGDLNYPHVTETRQRGGKILGTKETKKIPKGRKKNSKKRPHAIRQAQDDRDEKKGDLAKKQKENRTDRNTRGGRGWKRNSSSKKEVNKNTAKR